MDAAERVFGTVTGLLQLGLGPLSYFMGFNPFLNWAVTAQRSATNTSFGYVADPLAAGYIDADYNLTNPVNANVRSLDLSFNVAARSPHPGWAEEEFTVTWDGAVSSIEGLTLDDAGLTPASFDATARTATVVNAKTLKFLVGDVNDPPRSIKIYQTRYASNIANGEVFNPDWLAEVSKFKTLRFMDWLGTNGSAVVDFADFTADTSSFFYQGPPLQVICDLAAATGAGIHVNIPHQLGNADSDASVTAFATFFRDNAPAGCIVTFEYSNEMWNDGFTQVSTYAATKALAKYGSTDDRFRWAGYRAAKCMKLVRDAYGVGNRWKWRGHLSSLTGWEGILVPTLSGVDDALTELGGGLVTSDLFDEIGVTGYFGEVIGDCGQISAISQANPAVVTSAGHGLTTSDKVFISLTPADGMTELRSTSETDIYTVTVIDADTFSIPVDTTAYTAFTAAKFPYWMKSRLFELITASKDKFGQGLYDDQYGYFAEQIAEALATGTCSSGLWTVSGSIAALPANWANIQSYATARGLILQQYEGGSHFVGGNLLTGWGTDNAAGTIIGDAMIAASWTDAFARVYDLMSAAWSQGGYGGTASKYYESGQLSVYGSWGGVRWWPMASDADGDLSNPVWQATLRANAGVARFKTTG